ncbi:MAG: SDR family NAD(P)-dependent oxidoreductase [Elusimicrobia bacterium]|nr:SDR family NAD(P)-dependent oxidoreductase [Elusimicrobiota bacterium]
MSNKNLEPIAIIGIGAIMPEAPDKDIFWQNIINGKNCITEVSKETHWDPALFYSPDHSAPDKTYSKIGGFIRGFKFDSLKYRIPPQVAKQMDMVQCLAVEATAMALKDSGYDAKEFDRTRTAVIIGNAMGGMKGEMSNTRANAPLFNEIIKKTKTFASLTPAQAESLINEIRAGVDEVFLPITEDTMPGELSNVIAGRVANVFNLNGTNFTVDAACATSIAALDQAVNGLRMGNYDMAVCGGVDQMMSPSAYIKFCKIGALSADGSYSFDKRANGFVMAEGAGIVIVKRLSDAVRDGDKIYCVVRAVGASSDGKGKGITAPNPKGQKLAVEKTFEQLDYGYGDIGLIEAHGTATVVGDAVEVTALNECFGSNAAHASIGLGSIKSQIGHAKAAAGAASLIKTALALYNKVLPPSINFVEPNPRIDWANSPFRVITKTEPWNADKIRRANISSFGFGGTNFHVALEEMHPGLTVKKEVKTAACSMPSAAPVKETLMNTRYELLVEGDKLQGEMLTFSGATKQELINELQRAVKESHSNPLYIPQTAYKNHLAPQKHYAVVINVENAGKFKEKIEFFIKISSTMDVWTQDSLHLKMKGIYPFNPSKHTPKVCFMFPGQGSQYVDMMKDLSSKYKVVKDTFDEADKILKSLIDTTLTEVIWSKPGESKEDYARREEAIKQTQMTQPAVMTADVAMMRLLSSFGIKPEVVMGHSLGEYAAAVGAGIFDFENGLRSVTTRAKSMANIKVEDPGAMASISAPVETVEPELNKISGYIAIANKNCPSQTVIAGEKKSINEAVKMFTDMGIQSVLVPVSAAFHSQIIKPAEASYREFLNTLTVGVPRIPITSNVTADFYPSDPEKIKDLLVEQLVSSVEWIEQLKRTYDSGVRLFVECGPKRVLSAFAASTLDDKKDIKVLASNHPKKGGISEFNDLLANLTASGIPLDWGGTDLNDAGDILNPAYRTWALGGKAESSAEQTVTPAPEEVKMTSCNNKSVVISGIAAGTPGSWEKVFRDGALDEILQGRNFIEPIPADWQQKQIDKNVEYVIKSKDGNHRVEKLTDISQAIKLSARAGAFDVEKEFGLPEKWVASMDATFKLSIAAGILALKDAGIPLVLYYKPTTAGGYLPDRWGLPAEMIENTGIIFTSAFPNINSIISEVSRSLKSSLAGKSKDDVYKFYETLISKITDPALKKEITQWFANTYASYGEEKEIFAQDFLLKTIPIAHSHMAQWIRARGPATMLSGACASTAQAVAVASDWIKLGRAKRVIVISADDITNSNIQEWLIAAFLASGAATTEADVAKAAVPFDKRRNGMIVGMGAAALVVEEEQEVFNRGMKPLVRVLETEIRNSGFHPTRLDVAHVADIMNEMVTRAEQDYNINRSDIAKNLVFISHETYTPARGGSASAEVHALKRTFGPDVEKVIVSNTKGFTGHAMGAGIEDVIAVRSLNTGIIPPVANYQEPDPELAGITLSKGGKYNFKYSLRLGAGFGSQVGMTLMEKIWSEGEPRVFDAAKHGAWMQNISGQKNPQLEIVQNTLRIKDNFVPGQKPALIMEGSQAFVDKVAKPAAQPAAPAPKPVPVPAAPKPAVVAAAKKLDRATVQTEIINLISEKTGYPQDMLELDLDMEADLGIDTVKQAELFAAIREQYSIPQVEGSGIQLKDYPTINHVIGFVLNGQSSVAAPAPAAVPAPTPAPQPVKTVQASAVPTAKLDKAAVTKEIVNLISEKTGYPQDMLELDLDMEADLGIDTVKQAELFAAIREKYSIPQVEGTGIQLKDYPTINHVISFVLNGASGGAAQKTVPAPAAAKPVQAPAPQLKPAPAAPKADLNESQVTSEIVNLISEKTGYPQDMLELDLDMEADLGIDTVKQAELFAAIREKYSIPQVEGTGIQLKDYPTIRSVIGFVMNGQTAKPAAAVASAPAVTPAPVAAPVVAKAVAPAPAAKPSGKFDEVQVTKEIVNLISEKTGYPQDMLELDLDMEADLGIDTVKQAELFAAIREKYSIPQVEGSGIQLKDYPTIRHVVGFVINGPVVAPAPAVETPAPAPVAVEPVTPAPTPAAPAPKPAVEEKSYHGENYQDKKLRYVPTLVDAPLTEESERRLSTERPVLIFADSAPLIKAYQEWFKERNIPTHVFTTLKARSKNTTIVNWDSTDETEAVLREYQRENPGMQGIVYLLGAVLKKFDKKNNPHAELVKHVMPLFLALKVFAPDLSKRDDADTFFAVNIKLDASFGYFTKEAINPTAGSLSGAVQCFRKDMFEVTGGCLSKFLDFEPEDTPEEMANRTMFEILRGDMRFMISYKDGRRSTILSIPTRLDRRAKNFDLSGKTIAFTGCGRGIGALLSQKIAAQYKSKIIVLDIIGISEKTPLWASMNETELAALKNQIWVDLKANPEIKATPVLLDREFGKIKDSITLYRNLEKLRELGSEVEYYQCDVMNGTQMKEVVTKIKAKGGRVDGLIHFAGLERSKLVTDKTLEEFFRIFDVKATSGAAFLALNLVKDSGLYACATSIAGKYGNLGQSDYGSANEYLSKLCASLHNQGQRAISISMSAFSNIGMGIRPGVETFLKSNGVEFVDPQDGMQMFLDEIVYGKIPEIIMTDVLGKLDWDRQVKTDWEEIVEDSGNTPPPAAPAPEPAEVPPAPPQHHHSPAPKAVVKEEEGNLKENHFLGEIKKLTPGESIETEKEYSLESDHYLADHSIEGTPYVPGVMGLETFMEAASNMLGKTPKGLEDVHYFLPIKLLRNRPQKVAVKGAIINGSAGFEIESDFINSKGVKMGDTRRHFTARVLSKAESKWAAVRDNIKLTNKIIVPKEEIYKRYFHGPSFQVLGGVLDVAENTVLALYKRPEVSLFTDGPKKLIGYPLLVEAAFQACGYRDLSVDNRMNLPDSIGKYIVHGKGQSPETLYLYGMYKGLSIEGKSIYDAFVFDEEMNLWIELSDYYGIGQ